MDVKNKLDLFFELVVEIVKSFHLGVNSAL